MALGARMQAAARILIDKRLSSAEAHLRVARLARDHLALLISTGRGSAQHSTTVDGVDGAAEETVKLDGGAIVYSFAQGRRLAALRFALKYAKDASPNPGGPYSQAWFFAVDGRAWTQPLDLIPANALVMLVNFAPFARALEERGRSGRSGRLKDHPHPERVVSERTRQAVLTQFPGLNVQRQYVTIPGGPGARAMGWEVPYHLRSAGPNQGEAVLYPAIVFAPGA